MKPALPPGLTRDTRKGGEWFTGRVDIAVFQTAAAAATARLYAAVTPPRL